MLLAYLVCRIFNLNTVFAIFFSNISIPPMIPIVLYLSFKVGAVFQGEKAVELIFSKQISLQAIHANFVQYFTGALLLATIIAILGAVISFLILKLMDKRKRKDEVYH